MSDIDFDALDPEVKGYVEKLEDALLEARDELAKAAAPETNEEEDIFKSADPAVQAAVEELRKRADEAESIAKAEREARLQREFIEKAQSFQNLPTANEELGSLLKTLAASLDEDTFGKIETVLREADGLIGKSAWDEIGSGMTPSPSHDKAEELAKAMATEKGITYEQAYSEVLTEHPDLYNEYLSERA